MKHEPDAAILDLSAAIALNPRDIVAYRYRALAYDAKRDTKRADMDFARERQLEPVPSR
jgi:Tfp pilus assembly protein PilF